MPEMTGAQATRRLREAGFAGHILGMTGDPVGSSDRADFERSGTDCVLDKDHAAMRVLADRIRECAASVHVAPNDRRARKLARKRAQREGLLPAPKPRVPGGR